MKKCAFGVAIAAALIAGLTGSAALADNPHGTPPGQAKKDDAAAQPAPAVQSQPSVASADGTYTGPSPNPPSHYQGCSSSSGQSDGTGVKPSNDTKHNTCATAGSANTKEYGNGKTAGQIVTSRGGSPSTELFGPGNSQPHKVAVCKNGKIHFVDVHAVKDYSNACGPATSVPSAAVATAQAATTSVSAAAAAAPAPAPVSAAAVASLSIVKTQRLGDAGNFTRSELTAHAGEWIEYRIVVSNTGQTPLAIVLTDPHCDSTMLAPSGTVTVEAGSSQTYRCSHRVAALDGSTIVNTAVAVGTTPPGTAVGPVASRVSANKVGVLGATKVHTVKQVRRAVKKAAPTRVKAVRRLAQKPKPIVQAAHFLG
jgi:uncharacterized repeat protein (TIGR01451 family)